MADSEDQRPVGAFSDAYDPAMLRAFIAGRAQPFADDLLTIRDLQAAYEVRLQQISRTGLARIIHRSEISVIKDRMSLLGTAEIVAREKIRDDNDKSRQLEMLERERRSQPTAPSPAVPGSSSMPQRVTPPTFDRARFMAREQRGRTRVPTMAGEDDE